jgi:PAS domain S-box-containing protein
MTIAITSTAVSLTAGIFVLDLLTPLGTPILFLYLSPIFLSLWVPWYPFPFMMAGLCSILTGVGFFFSPPGIPTTYGLTNRLIGFMLFWTVAVGVSTASEADVRSGRLVFGLSRRTVANLASIGLSMILFGLMTYRVTVAGLESAQLVTHSHKIQIELSRILSAIKGAETGQMNFLLTGEDHYLEPYERAVVDVSRHLDRLNNLTQDNPLQQWHLRDFARVVEEKLAELRDTIAVRRSQGSEAALRRVKTGRGKAVMDDLHHQMAKLEGVERDLLVQREQQMTFLSHAQTSLVVLGGMALVGLMAVTVLLLRKEQTKQREMIAAMRLTLATLDATTDGTFVFDPLTLRFTHVNKGAVQQVGYSREELLRMTSLDIKPEFNEPRFRAMVAPLVNGTQPIQNFTTVHRRKDGVDIPVEINLQCADPGTAQARLIAVARDITAHKRAGEEMKRQTRLLEATNKELETFSYSVSHDLRAPLRRLEGLSLALLEDCSDRLDETGKDYIKRIRGEIESMEQLVEDLLKLALASRTELRRESVDLSALAASRAEEVRKQWSGRQVELIVGAELKAEGDCRLLGIVLDNLLGNAWKFTSGRERAIIEVGAERLDGKTVYFVRDNGAGFDMAHAGKLFGVFQRLHAATEYPGTGIGLALVQRIVHRHGGRVWAEGAVGKGTTVYFTLP